MLYVVHIFFFGGKESQNAAPKRLILSCILIADDLQKGMKMINPMS